MLLPPSLLQQPHTLTAAAAGQRWFFAVQQ